LLIHLLFQIDGAILTEAGDPVPSFRVERDQAVTRRHIQDPLLTAVGSVCQTTAR
jgi:hypothetical protein